MKKPYTIVPDASTPSSRELADWLAKDGQLLVPLVELLEKGERAIDEVIDVMGRATVEAVLKMSAEQVAGPKEQGRRDADRELYWHGVQAGRVALKERQLRVAKPRLRKKRPRAGESGEVEIPAYTALQGNRRLADRMLELMLHGVSTRKYEPVLPAMAEQVGISKSEVSRETIEAGTRVLQELAERDLSELDVLVVYLDGIQFADYHVLAAVGVDADGRKHVLGLCGGASENTPVTIGLLEDLVTRGLRADRRRLFVIDGAQALRKAIGQVFGSSHLVQRCRNHKLRNVLGHLPKDQQEQARSTLRAAWKLDAEEGIRKLEQYASWLEREWPSAAASLREGLAELFTVNRLGLPQSLRRCLTTTNIIDSSHAGVRQHTDRVSRWRNEEMAVRWAAVTFRETEKHYRRITGYEHLWMLKAHLDEEKDGALAGMQKVG
jgi:putative transposase